MVTATREAPAALPCDTCGNVGRGCKCIKLMPGPQTEFFQSKALHDGLFAGRRSGKTVVGVVKAFNYVFEHPGANGVMTAPDFPQFRRTVWPVIQQLFGHLQGTVWEWKEAQAVIRFLQPEHEGSVIYVRPGNEPSGFRGMGIAFFYMDEVAVDYQHETFLILSPALTQEGYPHQGWVTSTPDMYKPWLKKIWIEHAHPQTGDPMNPEEFRTFYANMKDNYHLPPGFYEKQKALYGDTPWARQELEGEFVTISGAAFPQFSHDIHVREPPYDIEFERECTGLDFGLSSPTSMHFLGLDRSKKIWVTREFYKRNADDYDWVRTATDWECKKIICDPSRAEKELSELRHMYGLPLRRAPFKDFDTRATMFGARLTVREDGFPGMYISPRCPNLIAEIPNLVQHQPRGHEQVYEKRWMQGTQDHAYDSTCYGLQGIDRMLPKGTKPPKLRVMI